MPITCTFQKSLYHYQLFCVSWSVLRYYMYILSFIFKLILMGKNSYFFKMRNLRIIKIKMFAVMNNVQFTIVIRTLGGTSWKTKPKFSACFLWKMKLAHLWQVYTCSKSYCRNIRANVVFVYMCAIHEQNKNPEILERILF